jgi:hypothetical protein
MFNFTDPTGTNFLADRGALDEYRAILDALYQEFARVPNSAFTLLEAFDDLAEGTIPEGTTVNWPAFPRTAPLSDEQIDRQRLTAQDEYIEWRTERDASGKVTRITFITEFPEYYQALAQVSLETLIAGIREVIPDANPTVRELLGTANDAVTGAVRARRFRANLGRNPWNNGEKGILCLTQGANTLGALLNLLARCGIPRPDQAPGNVCSLVSGACVPDRSSDPRVCIAAQNLARGGQGLSLADPAGVKILNLQRSGWQIDGQSLQINDLLANKGIWKIIRGGRRAILEVSDNLTLDGEPIVTGAQVSRALNVGADVISAPDTDLPDWARIGQETRG